MARKEDHHPVITADQIGQARVEQLLDRGFARLAAHQVEGEVSGRRWIEQHQHFVALEAQVADQQRGHAGGIADRKAQLGNVLVVVYPDNHRPACVIFGLQVGYALLGRPQMALYGFLRFG